MNIIDLLVSSFESFIPIFFPETYNKREIES